MKNKRKNQIKNYVSWALIIVFVALLAFLPMIVAQEEAATGPRASLLSAVAENREISTAVLGGGSLSGEDAAEITLPSAVKIKEYFVSNGDTVTEGQPIASLDRVSIMSAIAQVQKTMDYLQEQLHEVSDDTADDEVTAAAGGTVKIIYAAQGENVQDVILRDGALAVLSLDGLMAAEIPCESKLSGGDRVCVTLSDGSETEGRVESNLEGILTLTVADEGYAVGQSISARSEDGSFIGSGELYIHSQWNAVAYSGTVTRVRFSEGDTVKSGSTLFNLENTGHTAEFDALARQHREYEALMLELFKMYQSETLTAPVPGTVSGVDENGIYMLSSRGGRTVSLLANAPSGEDNTAYINYVGQVKELGLDGLILKLNPQAFSLTDYKNLSAVPMDTGLMTDDAVYTANVPVYELVGDEWLQIGSSSIAVGDILLFAGDANGGFVWVVRVARSAVPPVNPGDPDPTDPTDPTEPSDPTDPEIPSDSTDSARPQGGGNMSGFAGGSLQEESFELYGLDTVTVASVTPQALLTVQIAVDEWDIAQIYVGQSAQISLEALSGEKFSATVTEISNSGTNEGGNSKFTVTLTVGREQDMLPGMTAYVSIPLDTAQSGVCIPLAALIEEGTKTLVYTGYDAETEDFLGAVEVATGLSDGEYVQILSGINSGDTVYYPYYDTLVISNIPEMKGGFRFG